jgi:tetratricopeptide (TPR) repeat protein
MYAVFLVVVTMLSVILYALATGVISPPAPRTALEARLAVAEAALTKNAKSGKVWSDYILANTVAGQTAKAEKGWRDSRKALSANPEQRFYAELAWAQALMFMERYDEGIKQVDFVITYDTEALAALKKQDPVAAKAGILSTGALGSAYAVKGNCYVGLKQWEKAVEAYTSVLKQTPGAGDVYVSRGRAYLEMGRKDEARSDFKAALKLLPDDPTATEYLEKVGE